MIKFKLLMSLFTTLIAIFIFMLTLTFTPLGETSHLSKTIVFLILSIVVDLLFRKYIKDY